MLSPFQLERRPALCAVQAGRQGCRREVAGTSVFVRDNPRPLAAYADYGIRLVLEDALGVFALQACKAMTDGRESLAEVRLE